MVASARDFNLRSFSSISFTSLSNAVDLNLTNGYARIQAAFRQGEYGLPGGFAIFSKTQNGVLSSEASVPAQPLISSGRTYVEIAGPMTTGIAIANPNAQPVTVNFFFTDANGRNFGQGSTTINVGSQIATLLTEAPFNAPSSVQATFTFTSSLLVSAIGLRGFTNERGELLTTTLPLSEVGVLFPIRRTIPQFADGGGWQTSVILLNPSDATITGELRLFAQSGDPLTVALNGVASSIFSYSIAPRSFQRFRSPGTSANVQVGFASIVPVSSDSRPSAFVLFRYKTNGITTTETSLSVPQGAAGNNIVVESSGDATGGPRYVQSGIAIAYTGAIQQVSLQFLLYTSDGKLIGSTEMGPRSGQWQMALMLNEISGLPPITSSFRGILRVVASGGTRFTGPPSVTVAAIRARFNERGEFLITSTPPLEEVFFTSSSELLFPHFAVGGAYETQFLLFTDIGATGTMYLFDQNGNPLSLSMR